MRKESDYFALIIEGLLVFMILMAVPTLVSSYDASYGIPISCSILLGALILLVSRRKKSDDKRKRLEPITIIIPSFLVLSCQVAGTFIVSSDGRHLPFSEFLIKVGQYCKNILFIVLALAVLIKLLRWIGGGVHFKIH